MGAVRLLLAKGADITVIDCNGLSPQDMATSAQVRDLLLSKGEARVKQASVPDGKLSGGILDTPTSPITIAVELPKPSPLKTTVVTIDKLSSPSAAPIAPLRLEPSPAVPVHRPDREGSGGHGPECSVDRTGMKTALSADASEPRLDVTSPGGKNVTSKSAAAGHGLELQEKALELEVCTLNLVLVQ